MEIKLKQELVMNSYKTIDGRGPNVHISNGPCITAQFFTNIIIHGVGNTSHVRQDPTSIK